MQFVTITRLRHLRARRLQQRHARGVPLLHERCLQRRGAIHGVGPRCGCAAFQKSVDNRGMAVARRAQQRRPAQSVGLVGRRASGQQSSHHGRVTLRQR